jgi:hypothetical protein
MHTVNCEYCGEPLEGLVVGLLHKHCRDALNKELYEIVETSEAEGFEMADSSNFSEEDSEEYTRIKKLAEEFKEEWNINFLPDNR